MTWFGRNDDFPPSHRRKRTERGFSLVELMVTLTVLGIGLLGVAQLIPFGLGRIGEATLRNSATNALRSKMDELGTLHFSEDRLAAGNHTETRGAYSLGWTVKDNVPLAGGKRVDMTVSWKNSRAQTESFQVTTYLMDKP